MVLLEIHCSLQQWKNFANRSRIDKVIAMVMVAPFFWFTVYNMIFCVGSKGCAEQFLHVSCVHAAITITVRRHCISHVISTSIKIATLPWHNIPQLTKCRCRQLTLLYTVLPLHWCVGCHHTRVKTQVTQETINNNWTHQLMEWNKQNRRERQQCVSVHDYDSLNQLSK